MHAHACIHANTSVMAKNITVFTHSHYLPPMLSSSHITTWIILLLCKCFLYIVPDVFHFLCLSLSLCFCFEPLYVYKACLKNIMWLHGILSISPVIFFSFFCYTKPIYSYSYIEMYREGVKIFWGKSCSLYFKKKLLLLFLFFLLGFLATIYC